MNRKSARTTGPVRVRSWKSIQQEVSRSSSGARKTTIWKVSLIWLAAMLFSVGIIFGAYVLLFEPEKLFSVGPDFRIESIHLDTDGWLDEAWVRETLELEGNTPLLQADIFEMRNRILRKGQVEECIIRKRLPDTLEIRIREREPVVRFVQRSETSPTALLLVSRDGTLFAGYGFPAASLRRLPFLSGIDVVESPEGIRPIPGFQRVADLLDLCRNRFPEIYRNWRIIDLSLYDPDPLASFSSVRVRSEDAREILFTVEDYATQLLRLQDILAFSEERGGAAFQRVDLRFKDAVPVRQ